MSGDLGQPASIWGYGTIRLWARGWGALIRDDPNIQQEQDRSVRSFRDTDSELVMRYGQAVDRCFLCRT